ncbi:MAG: hypothetical protein KC656_09190 [Myxococcales bacterium]|nr:hypothetical protein [Myxococcales bacterium]MCB9670643.1 hypothetical protein [Alphaproteobacteria bacterium]MCB9693795.1 hypothetical protein [Alphaproteobacteria bacterium]
MGPQPPSYRETVLLPVGWEDKEGNLHKEAEVRPVTGADELWIGMSPQYARHPNDLVYKTLLLSRTVTRLGPKTKLNPGDIGALHALDVRALEYAVYRLTYGEENLPEEDPSTPGG